MQDSSSFFKSKYNRFPREGVILAIDYGDWRIGLARSDYSQKFAFSGECIQLNRNKNYQDNWEHFISIISETITEYDVQGVVVGLPLNMDGSIGDPALKVLQFAEFLEAQTMLPVRVHDERLSTYEAKHRAGSAGTANLDNLAAQIILEGYLGIPNSSYLSFS
jgi:putative holliday junction resolvase